MHNKPATQTEKLTEFYSRSCYIGAAFGGTLRLNQSEQSILRQNAERKVRSEITMNLGE